MSILDNLPHTVAIRQQVRTTDNLRGEDRTWPIVIASVQVWVQTASQSEILLYDKQGVKVTHKVYFDPSSNVDERQMIVYITGGVTKLLEVVSFADAGVNQIELIKVMCMEMTSDVDGVLS